MLNNAPVQKLKHDGLTVEGYSRAAVQSYWRIPELKLGFDLGAHPWDFMGTPTWLISHCHLDHIAALPLYVARRRLMKMSPPKIYLPQTNVDAVRQMLNSFVKLDRGKMPCDLIGVAPGDEIEISRELVVNVYETKHTVPSVGYIISERRKKLKTEYLGLGGDEIKSLRANGTEITTECRMPLVGFTGDTSPAGLDNNPEFYETKILITEMTFISPEHRKELIHKNGHMHLDDFIAREDKFNNEIIIAGHFSTRYSLHQSKKLVSQQLPGMLGGRLKLWV
ncbi:MAG: MBL fold metallo-hydrolase [Pirellulales bacterium]|jgi:ribonuclease Z